MLESGAPTISGERRFIRPDGAQQWIEARGRVVRSAQGRTTGLAGTLVDITNRKATKSALRTSEDAFGTLVETLPGYIMRVNADRRFLLSNRELSSALAEDMIGRDVLEWIARTSRDAFARALEMAFESGELQEL